MAPSPKAKMVVFNVKSGLMTYWKLIYYNVNAAEGQHGMITELQKGKNLPPRSRSMESKV